MRSTREYVKCSCGNWAVIERAEDKQHRDRIKCSRCGSITVMDNISAGRRVELKEDEDDKIGDNAEIGVKKYGENDDDQG